jgi:uncharacterized protein (UPF0303 family)
MMQDEKLAAQAMAETIRKQEADLVFSHFDNDTAWLIGQSLRKHAAEHGGNVSIDITVGGLQLFHSVVGHPTPNNDNWVRRKRSTVLEFWKSSLLVAKEMKASGRTLLEHGLSENDMALSGGSFPIRLKDLGVVGAVTVSGLPQTHDHQLIVDTLSGYLGVKTESVL